MLLADIDRALKKLSHKNRKDPEAVAKLQAAAGKLKSAIASEEAGASPTAMAMGSVEEGTPPEPTAPPTPTAGEGGPAATQTGQWRDMVDQAEALETLGLAAEADSNDIDRAVKKLSHKLRNDAEALAKVTAAAETLARVPPSPLTGATGGLEAVVEAAVPIEVRIEPSQKAAGFTCDEALNVTDVNSEGAADRAGVSVGMKLTKFQGEELGPDMTWKKVKGLVKAAAKPWVFSFSGEAPAPDPETPAPAPAPAPTPAPAPPPKKEWPPCVSAMKHKEAGNKFYKVGAIPEAIAAYTKAIESLPSPDHIEGSCVIKPRLLCTTPTRPLRARARGQGWRGRVEERRGGGQ